MFVLIARRLFNQNLFQHSHQLCKKSTAIAPPLDFNELKHKTKVPLKSTVSLEAIKTEKVAIDPATLELLVRLSLVNLTDQEALKTLEDSIEFASKILHVDTAGIEPLFNVNEQNNESLALRDDIVTEGNIRDILLENAPVNDDVCFVAPPGNIPVELDEQDFKPST